MAPLALKWPSLLDKGAFCVLRYSNSAPKGRRSTTNKAMQQIKKEARGLREGHGRHGRGEEDRGRGLPEREDE